VTAIPLVGPAYTERSPDLNAQTLVNWYPVAGGPDGRTGSALYPTPGLKAFARLGSTAVRGMHVFGDVLLAVSGSALYTVDLNSTATQVGTLNTSAGRVAMANNGTVALIVDGIGGYIWDGTALAQVTDPDMPAATHVAFLGGYFVLNDPSAPGRFRVSKLNATDPADLIDPLDFATAESDPDPLVALAAHEGRIWLLGANTTEVWFQSGEVFPFNPQTRLARGCIAPASVAVAGDALMWLASDVNGRIQVVAGSGGQIVNVSTPALEFALGGAGDLSSATGYGYHQEGHTFYALNTPTATWVFDLTTKQWHRRGVWDGIGYARHEADTHAYFGGAHRVGSYRSGEVFTLDLDTFTDNGQNIRRERVAPVLHADGAPLFLNRLEVIAETGHGDNATPAPLLMVDLSTDGGRTWGGDRLLGLGAIGEFQKRGVLHRLGRFRRVNVRFAVSDAVKVVVLGAVADVEVGT